MSAIPESHGRPSCSHCDSPRDPSTSVKGSFCSAECYFRHRGQKVLRKIQHDHRFCATCFLVRKEIDTPPDPWLRRRARLIREAVIGIEYRTRHVEHGPGFTYCKCGTVEHSATHEWMREADIRTTIENCLAVLHQLYDEGQLDTQPDKYTFVRTLHDHDRDWALATGRALFAKA